MSMSSTRTTTQLDRSLFSDDAGGALTEFLLDACSVSEGLVLGLDCPSNTYMGEKHCDKQKWLIYSKSDVQKFYTSGIVWCNCVSLFLICFDDIWVWDDETSHDIISVVIPWIVFAGVSLLGWSTSVCGPGNPEASTLLWYSCSSFPAHWAWASMAPLWRSQCRHPSAVLEQQQKHSHDWMNHIVHQLSVCLHL